MLTKTYFSGSRVEFGAEQCGSFNFSLFNDSEFSLGILVRDENARDKLREMIGDIGLIM